MEVCFQKEGFILGGEGHPVFCAAKVSSTHNSNCFVNLSAVVFLRKRCAMNINNFLKERPKNEKRKCYEFVFFICYLAFMAWAQQFRSG